MIPNIEPELNPDLGVTNIKIYYNTQTKQIKPDIELTLKNLETKYFNDSVIIIDSVKSHQIERLNLLNTKIKVG